MTPQKPARILSGIQPSGGMTLGNYLGAIRNWVALQDEAPECFYMLVDLHVITVPYEISALKNNTYEMAAALLACGLDPKKMSLFCQSHVPAHAQLGWLLMTQTPLGWLNRMTQFKDKAGKNKEKASLGLYGYPVLQAADILLYKPSHVPVGEDQRQHLELSREIAGAFNRHVDTDFFPLPEPYIPEAAARIMSLRDGTKKMSKSDPSDQSRINLRDDADTIAKKIRKATTDPQPLPESSNGLNARAEAKNLLTIYGALSGRSLDDAVAEFAGKEWREFKSTLADLVVAKIAPISEGINDYLNDTASLDAVLKQGADRANTVAEDTLKDAYNLMGFLPAERGAS